MSKRKNKCSGREEDTSSMRTENVGTIVCVPNLKVIPSRESFGGKAEIRQI